MNGTLGSKLMWINPVSLYDLNFARNNIGNSHFMLHIYQEPVGPTCACLDATWCNACWTASFHLGIKTWSFLPIPKFGQLVDACGGRFEIGCFPTWFYTVLLLRWMIMSYGRRTCIYMICFTRRHPKRAVFGHAGAKFKVQVQKSCDLSLWNFVFLNCTPHWPNLAVEKHRLDPGVWRWMASCLSPLCL